MRLSSQLVLGAVSFACLFACVNAAQGTTSYLPQIFMGRCLDVIAGFASPIRDYKSNINCTLLWISFQNAYIGRDPMTINEDSFSEYFAAADQRLESLLFFGLVPTD